MIEARPLAGVGARLRAARKLVPGMTQQRLADRAHVSLSLVKAVEQGRAPATAAFVAAVAPVLGLTVYDLWGQPSPRYGAERAGIAALETAVMAGPALAGDDPPRPLDELATRVTEITDLYDSCRYDLLSLRAADLLEDLHTAAAHQPPGADAERAHQLLAVSYNYTRRCLHALGSPLAGQAAERAMAGAASSGDPLLAALYSGATGVVLTYRGSYSAAARVTEHALVDIADQPASPAVLTVRGDLHLRMAILAARRGDRQSSDLHLDEASDAATHLPDSDHRYGTFFSASNVTASSRRAASRSPSRTAAEIERLLDAGHEGLWRCRRGRPAGAARPARARRVLPFRSLRTR